MEERNSFCTRDVAESMRIIQLRRLLITINHSQKKMRGKFVFMQSRAIGALFKLETDFSHVFPQKRLSRRKTSFDVF